MVITPYREYCRQFNLSQTTVGTPLITLKGSKIRRSRYGVGKPIGGNIYLHKSYYKCLPAEAQDYYDSHVDRVPFEFNCLRYDTKTHKLAFIECPDFDEAREPMVGRIYTFNENDQGSWSRFYQQVYHHKWAMVKNDYKGFDVAESWNWSKEWLNVLPIRADGSCLQNWLDQLEDWGLR